MMRFLMPVLCCLLAACGAQDGGSVRPAQSDVLARGTSVLVPLPDGSIVVEEDGRLLSYDPSDAEIESRVIGPAATIGEVHLAVRVDGAILVLASGGTFILRDGSWVPSPLADSFDGPIVDAELLPTSTGHGLGDLWVATASSLYRIRDAVAERFVLDDDLRDVHLAVAQRPEGPALWVRLPDRLLEVWRDRNGAVRSASLLLDVAPSAIGGDAASTGWLVIDGRLHSIGPDRRLVDHGVQVARLLASSQSREAWVIDTEGAVWLNADGRLWSVPSLTLDPAETMAIATDGALYVSGATIRRYSPRRSATVLGPPSGSLLVTPQTFEIEAEGAPTVEASVDGQPVSVERDPTRVALDPVTLGEGSHELVVRITYDDETLPVVDRRTFEVITDATWRDDIEPLYTANCASCHGPEGSAVTRLGTRDEWQRGIEIVLRNVAQGRMPLGRPPLSRRDIALIQAWQVGGFAE